MSNRLTVYCCTANRPDRVVDFIEKWLAHERISSLCIVENSVNLDTFHMLTRLFDQESAIELIRSAPPGLSRARNLALDSCKSEFIAFTDDDCEILPGWEEELLRIFETQNADAIFGKIEPLWPWDLDESFLTDGLLASLALFDLGNKARLLNNNEFGVGANMAFRTSKIKTIRFNENLGRTGQTLLSNEEYEFQIRLKEVGIQRYYAPTVRVGHRISSDRLTPNWFISRFAWQGVSDALSSDESIKTYNRDFLNRNLGHLNENVLLANWDNLEWRASILRGLICSSLAPSPAIKHGEIDGSKVITRPINSRVTKVLVEYLDSHAFLPLTLSEPHTHLFYFDGDPWKITGERFQSDMDSLALSINRQKGVKEVIFTSVESFLLTSRFNKFRNTVISLGVPSKFILHRIPEFDIELGNLKRLSKLGQLIVLSRSIEKTLLEIDVECQYVPLTGVIRPRKPRNEPKLVVCNQITLGVFGELRDMPTLTLIEREYEAFTQSQKTDMVVKFVGGCRDRDLWRKIDQMKQRFNTAMDFTKVRNTSADSNFRGLNLHEYESSMTECDAILKLQPSEPQAASAVVADALSLGVPVFALSGTESGNQVSNINDCFVITPDMNLFNKILQELKKPIDKSQLRRTAENNFGLFRYLVLHA